MGLNIGGLKLPSIDFGKIGKSLIEGAVKAVAPKVIEQLKGVAGDLFTKGTDGLKGLLGNTPVVGKLLSGLVDKLAPQLKGMIEGGLDKALKGLVEKFTGVKLENGQEVTKPALSEQTGETGQNKIMEMLQGLMKQIGGGSAAGTGGAGAAAPTQQAASSGGASGAAPTQQAASSGGASGAAPTQQAASGGGSFSPVSGGNSGASGVGGASGGSTVRGGSLDSLIKGSLATGEAAFSGAENDMLKAAADGGASPAQLNQMKAQFKLQHLQELMSFISNYMKKMNDISMSVISNMK